MKSRSLFVLGVGVTALSLFAVACGDDDDPAPANTGGKGGSAGSSAGAAGSGAGTGGSAGAAAGTGGSAGAAAGTGGSAGAAAGTGGSAGAAAGTGGSAGAAAGTGGSAGAGGGAAKKGGRVGLSQTIIDAGGTPFISTSASASFDVSVAVAPPAGACTFTTESGCSVSVCVSDEAGAGGAGGAAGSAGAAGAPSFASAGEIAVTGLKTDLKLAFTDAATGYKAVGGSARLFDGGESVKISAAGADVPKFEGTLTAPIAVKFTKPVAATAPAKTEFDSTAPLAIEWDADAKAKIHTSLTASVKEGTKTTITSALCVFDGAAKTASIPAAVVAKLPKGDVLFLASELSSTTVAAGDYDVNLSVSGGTTLAVSGTVK